MNEHVIFWFGALTGLAVGVAVVGGFMASRRARAQELLEQYQAGYRHARADALKRKGAKPW